MIVFDSAVMQTISLHKVGNKSRDEELRLSSGPIELADEIKSLLMRYFLSPFKKDEFYNLHNESDLNLNAVYTFASKIFDNPDTLHENSVHLAKHLYEQSTHPKINSGEFYVVYFTDCIIWGELTDAIGIFKSESKDTFLKIYPKQNNFEINKEDGININKLDKGCIILNTEKERGFCVAIVDNISKGSEAVYWRDDFLSIKPREDNYYFTQNTINLCKTFITEELPGEVAVSRAEQAELLNRSAEYFKSNEGFDIEDFTEKVIIEPKYIESFTDFKDRYEDYHGIELADNFEINNSAVKRQAKIMKSVIKLDKNFHIYVHGKAENIEQGYDEDRHLNFYKLFYIEES